MTSFGDWIRTRGWIIDKPTKYVSLMSDLTTLTAQLATKLEEIYEVTHDPVIENSVASARHEQWIFREKYSHDITP